MTVNVVTEFRFLIHKEAYEVKICNFGRNWGSQVSASTTVFLRPFVGLIKESHIVQLELVADMFDSQPSKVLIYTILDLA